MTYSITAPNTAAPIDLALDNFILYAVRNNLTGMWQYNDFNAKITPTKSGEWIIDFKSIDNYVEFMLRWS